MHPDELLNLIFADQTLTLDDVAQTLEAQLPQAAVTEHLLERVRWELRNGDEHEVLRGMLVSARHAPATMASATAIYGMWLARKHVRHVSLDLLRVAAWAAHWAGNEVGRARALVNLASALYVRDQFVTAQQSARAAVNLFMQEEDITGIIKGRLVLANVAYELQQPEAAATLCHDLLGLVAMADDAYAPEQHVDILINLGLVAEDLQDAFELARTTYAEAEALLPQIPQPMACRFRLRLNQGYLALRLGQHADARYAFDQAEQALTTGLPAGNLTSADTYDLRLAQIQQALLLGDRTRARSILGQLQTLHDQGEKSPKQQAEIDALAATLSDDPSAAQRLFQQAMSSFHTLTLGLLELNCTLQLAEWAFQSRRVSLAQDALAQARQLLAERTVPRRLLEIRRIAAQYDPSMSLAEREAVAQDLEQVKAYLGAVAVWDAIGRRHELAKNLVAATAAYGHAITLAEQARGMVRLSLNSLQLLSARRRAYDRALALASDPQAAFTISEQARAQVLLDEMSNAGLWRLLAQADLDEIRAAYTQMTYEQARTSLRTPRAHQAELRDEPTPEAELHAAERTYFAALERIQVAKLPQAGWIAGTAQPTASIQAALPPDSLLAAYTLVAGHRGPELWLSTLSAQGETQTRCIANAARWKGFVKQWPTGGLLDGNVSDHRAAQTALNELYAIGIDPLHEQLTNIRHVIIALDERMPLLPLHAAYDHTYLIERLAVSYTPSGSALALLHKRHQGRTPGGDVLLAGWDAADSDLDTLVDIPVGLDELATLLNVPAWHGPHTPEALATRMAEAAVAHLSYHGVFPVGGSPRFANLVIGAERFYADELYRAKLQAALLFLNACDSGQHGEGLQGLVSAALVAGASAVIATMWKVQPKFGRTFPQRFYTHWQAGLTCVEALRQAQMECVKASPVTWAPYYLTGLPAITLPGR
ncbi:MAG: CHAT domain-containing protein [Chloroflexales bacterium]